MLRPLVLASLLACAAGYAADEPLRVYAYGAAGASVYVAPTTAIGAAEASSAEIGYGAFARKYLRGTVPAEVQLKPGTYLVSVVLSADQSMRDASIKAGEHVWDGFDHHALVGQKRNTWRYAHCYRVEKKQGFPAEVLAVFTDQMPVAAALSFSCGTGTTPFTGTDDEAGEALTAERIPLTFHNDIIKGLKAGMKVLLRTENDRFAIQADGPSSIRISVAHGQGAWAGHKLSIVPYE